MKRVLLAVCVLGLFLGRAEAQNAADKVQAKKLYLKGMSLFGHKQYKQAASAFLKAYRVVHIPDIEYNLAIVYYKQGDVIRAVKYLRRYLKHVSVKERQAVPGPLLDMQRRVGVLVVRVPSKNALVVVGGKVRGRGGLEMVLKPGRTTVWVRIKGRVVASKVVDILPGTEKVWELSAMRGSFGAQTHGRREFGDHHMRSQPKKPIRLGRLHWGYFAGTLALALGLGAGGLVTGLKTLDVKSKFDKTPTDDLKAQGEQYRTLTNVFIGLSAGAATAAIVLAVFTRWHPKTKEDQNPGGSGFMILPSVAPDGGMLTIQWRR
ncbi:MAG: hypothetical protein J7M25_04175 [Deltaproteobacteria bacterium]|nr:hypothetical protein [Deltaproteobacteria bacterium]